MKKRLLEYWVGAAFAMLLLAGGALAQEGACSLYPYTAYGFQCYKPKMWVDVGACAESGDPCSYCLIGGGECDNPEDNYDTATGGVDCSYCGDDDDDDTNVRHKGGACQHPGRSLIGPPRGNEARATTVAFLGHGEWPGLLGGRGEVKAQETTQQTTQQLVMAPAVKLAATARVEGPLTRTATMGESRDMCDAAGNLYTRQNEAGFSMREFATQAFQKITPTGSASAAFRVTDAVPGTGTKPVVGRDFFVTASGRVFQLAWVVRDDVYVVEFAQDGSVKSRTQLQTYGRVKSPYHLAVFDTGEYLLTGDAGKDGLVPFTAVFAPDGRLLKEIREPEDEEASRNASPADRDSRSLATVGGNGGTDFVRFGGVAMGSDGNAYLLHGTTSFALVYVISSGGDVVRKLRIDSGTSDLIARSIKYYAGRLAIEFDQLDASGTLGNVITLSDPKGNLIARYTIDPVEDHDSLYLAGYGANGFTFTPYYHRNKLYMIQAKLP